MKIIDTHAHLYDLKGPEAALLEAGKDGVSDVIVLGVDLASNEKHLELQTKTASSCYPRFHLALGLHPGNITTPQETQMCLDLIRTYAAKIVAIGEIGLDYHYKWVINDDKKKQEQRDVFRRQLLLAKEFDLPVVVHARSAFREALDMTIASGVGKVDFHWYTGPVDMLKETLDAGFMVSVSPALEYSPEAQAVARYAPLERLLIETDTPVRGWTPKDVWRTLDALALIKGMPREDVLNVVNLNAKNLFGL